MVRKAILFLVIVFVAVALFLGIYRKFFLKPEKPISSLSYQDLVELSKPQKLNPNLAFRLNKQLTTPYVISMNKRPSKKAYERPYLRVAHWNITRGFNIDALKMIFGSGVSYFYAYKKNYNEEVQRKFKKEIETISKNDIISLNEVDVGMPRTKYKNIAFEIAKVIGYNYAFATEFIELNPLVTMQTIDQDRYLGLHGNAILSKYPIKEARVVRLPECYKWFDSEVSKRSPLEYARRVGAKTIFQQEILSEVRRGNRCALVTDIELPGKEIVTVVSTHLEDRAYPDCRYKQVEYLFEKIKNITNPLVIAGDLNTSCTDAAPTSFKKEVLKRVRDPDFVARQLALAFIPLGLPVPGLANLASVTLSRIFQYKDPAFPNVPIFFPNHERRLFKYIKNFQFADGEKFDMRGSSNRSSNGKRGLLANSNERQLKGFESTFKFEEPRVIAYFKFDWFFVKPKNERFEPFNGQTLKLVNEAYEDKVSEHDLIVVDLTLAKDQNVSTLLKHQ